MDNRNVMNNPTPEFLEWARRDTEPKSPFDSVDIDENDLECELDRDYFGEIDSLDAFF